MLSFKIIFECDKKKEFTRLSHDISCVAPSEKNSFHKSIFETFMFSFSVCEASLSIKRTLHSKWGTRKKLVTNIHSYL